MSNVVCSKCGATANSKCPTCHSIFMANQHEALLSWGLKVKMSDDARHVEFTVLPDDSPMESGTIPTEEELKYRAIKKLSWMLDFMQDDGLTDEERGGPVNPDQLIRSYACDHKWVFAEGQHSEIGCGH